MKRSTDRAQRSWLSALLLVALTLISGAGPAWAAGPKSGAAVYSFAFRDAEITQVAEEVLGSTLGLSYSLDPSVSGKMSFRVDSRMTPAELLEAFENALNTNGVVVIRQGASLLLTTRAKAASVSGVKPADAGISRAGYQVVSVPLSFAVPSEVAKLLASAGPGNIVLSSDDKAGIIVLGGTGREIEAALQSIRAFDRSGMDGERVRWFELQSASASMVAGEINQVTSAAGGSGGTVVPLRRLNALIAFARTPEALDEIGRLVEKLDRPGRDEASTLWVYHPLNVPAESLARTLATVLPGVTTSTAAAIDPAPTAAGQSPGQTPPPTSSSPQSTSSAGDPETGLRIGVDTDSNLLLISGPASSRPRIQKILDEIDIPPVQVLIEASILEVTLSDEFRAGVRWSDLAQGGKLKIISTGDTTGAISPTLPGLALTYLDDDVRAAIDALGSKTSVEVISSPKIMSLSNRTAVLQIGDQVPVVVQRGQSTAAPDAPQIVNVEYRDTGVILNVTPRVTGDRITLTINQEVSAVAKTTTSGIDSPTIQQRRMESTLLIKDGGLVALGGLISSTRSRGDSGVPGLKDVPVIGNLFKTQSRDNRRTELIVLLTATIVRAPEESDRAMADLLADMKEIEARGLVKP